jgi:hypothetical protein
MPVEERQGNRTDSGQSTSSLRMRVHAIFFRFLGSVLLFASVGGCSGLLLVPHPALGPETALTWLPVAYCAAAGAIAIGVLMLRRTAALVLGVGLTLIAAAALIAAARAGIIAFAMTSIFAVPLLCVVAGIVYCWRDLKSW